MFLVGVVATLEALGFMGMSETELGYLGLDFNVHISGWNCWCCG